MNVGKYECIGWKWVGLPQLNPQTFHKATDIGCGSVALDEHVKGDSKTYLILLIQVVCISVVNPQ